ncbi:MAG TPA: AAA family ATPase [Streptosporangiaceae bacterium]|nr:AAA family ATPase [Streptosporangiaceae bacterium]
MLRARELEVVGQQFTRLGQHGFRLVTLVGDPGIGKTRLLAEVAALAQARSHIVVSARASEADQTVALHPLIEALEERVVDAAAALLPQLDAGESATLAAVFPRLRAARAETSLALAPSPPAAVPDEDAGRLPLFRTIRHSIELLGQPHGLVLILDDMHWADTATIGLIDHLLRYGNGPVLLVLALRPKQVSPEFAAALAMAPANRVVQIELGPLSLAQAGAMLDPPRSPPRQKWIYDVSEGIPLCVEALSKIPDAEVDRARLSVHLGPEFDHVPHIVRATLVSEISSLPAEVRAVARAAAVAGDDFDAGLVEAIVDGPVDSVLYALDLLSARDVVRPVAGSGRFRFRHPLMRSAIYAMGSAGWRVTAHSRAADYLGRVGAPPTARAYHIQCSARFGDESAVIVLAEAARAVGVHAPATAAHWLRVALTLLPDTAPPDAAPSPGLPTRLDLTAELAEKLAVGGQLAEGLEVCREALRLLPDHGQHRRVQIVLLLSRLERLLGDYGHSRPDLLAELASQPPPSPTDTLRLKLELAMHDHVVKGVPGWRAGLASLLEPDLDGSAHPIINAARATATEILDDSAGHAPADAAALIDALDTRDVEQHVEVMEFLAWAELICGHAREAARHFDRAAKAARVTGQRYVLAGVLSGGATALALLGEFANGRVCAEEAADAAVLLGTKWGLSLALQARSDISLWAGDYTEAADLADKAGEAADRGQLVSSRLAQFTHAMVRIGTDDFEVGGKLLLSAMGGPAMPHTAPFKRLLATQAMARVEACLGHPDQAGAWANRAADLARPGELLDEGFVHLARAHAHSFTGAGDAILHARAAAQAFSKAGLRPLAGQAALVAGEAAHRIGDRATAVAEFSGAARIFAECGADGALARVQQAQRRLGVRVPTTGAKAPSPPLGLSQREAEVAELLSAGCTNREIAGRLMLSVRTVETHVKHIFGKLDVNSRAAAISILVQHLDSADAGR